MEILIITHAGVRIGLGHFSRSLVVAKALRDEIRAEVRLMIQSPPIERQDLQCFAHDFINPADDLCGAVQQQLWARPCQAVVFDLQKARRPDGFSELLVDLSLRQLVVAAIDDALDFLDLVDLVFIPAFHLDSATLPGVGTGKVFSGWDCLLLGVDAPQPTPKLYGTHVLLLTGGSDAAGLGVRWPAELVTHLPDGTVVDWVTGPFSPSPQLLAGGLVTFREHQAPSGLSPLMLQASYALTVFGVSFFELLYHGVPTVVYSPYGDRDTPEMAALQQADVALIARTEDEAPQLLRQLMTDDDLADRLSRRAQAKVDGQGGLRFAQAVKERVDSRWHVPT